MPQIIAVDKNLGNVRRYLQDKGYVTTDLHQGFGNASAIVVSGMSSNLFGDETVSADAPIIDAAGLTEEEVLDEVEKRMQLKRH